MSNLENELLELIEEEFEGYLDECDLEEGGDIDEKDFAEYAKETIEHNLGEDKFDDFDIKSYALDHVESNRDALAERARCCADSMYDCYKESLWV